MDRAEVAAVVVPTVRPAVDKSRSKREEITFDVQDDEEFLRSLEEQLQQRMGQLDQLELVLGAKQINYVAFRLHEALEPKRDPQTNLVHAWTIQPQTQLKIKMSSHIQVLKLSTILREVKRLRIHQQSTLRSPIEVDIFPSLQSLEVVHTDVAALRNVHFFAGQLRVLRIEHSAIDNLDLVLSPESSTTTWNRLESLRVNCCALALMSACVNRLDAIKILDCSWNEITHFEAPATFDSIQWLDLCHNKLAAFPPLSKLTALKVLDLSMNNIQSLRGVDALIALAELDVSNNALISIGDLELLTGLRMLRRLVVRENPISRRPDYRREVLFYLGQEVVVDDVPWQEVELSSMKNSRRLLAGVNTPKVTDTNALWTRAAVVPTTCSPTRATMVYPALARRSQLVPVEVAIHSPVTRYSPHRKLEVEGSPSTATSIRLTTLAEDQSVEEALDGDDDLNDITSLATQTVDAYFRNVWSNDHVPSRNSVLDPLESALRDATLVESDSDESSSDKGRNRSRKYTESDFMRDFEEEEQLELDHPTGALERPRRSSSSTRHSKKKRSKSDTSIHVRVLLSAEDAAIFDLTFGIDGLAATVEFKAHELVETLFVPDRESAIGFSRRLLDVVAIGTLTQSTRAKIVVLKVRKTDRLMGTVTYQVDDLPSMSRLLGSLLWHVFSQSHHSATTCVCVVCGGISFITTEYVDESHDSMLHACLLCSALNVREVSRERMLAIYASEGITHLAKSIAPAVDHLVAHFERGFVVEEQNVAEGETRVCVMVSSCGIRETSTDSTDNNADPLNQ